MSEKSLSLKEKIAFGIGAVGKDMVYMLSASYILYYYQDIMGVSAVAMGIILLAARVFDAFNDPIMGVIVAKTKTRWGKFRPWLFIGTVTNAIILFLMFAAPPALNGAGLVAYAAVTYILWGVTYTMMDIPFWSMIPAFTKAGKEREGMSALGRSCAGVGSALVTIVTVLAVRALGTMTAGEGASQKMIEMAGYKWFSLVIAVLFVLFTVIMCISIKEKSTVDMRTPGVGEMFKALIKNDQAVIMVCAIVLINTALYTTSNLTIYFFKYDFGGANAWEGQYTLFNTASGGFQILAMMILFPVLRKFMNSMKIMFTSFGMAFAGYISLLAISLSGSTNVYLLLVPAFLIMSALGMMNVVLTIFLANTCDYGELKNGRRDESVIFSMQTFVVKLSSGIAALFASLILQFTKISELSKLEEIQIAADASRTGLRFSMTLIPMVFMVIAIILFKRKYSLTDERMEEIQAELATREA
ncbi:MAG: glycoside-pentoside-hexuronide (GPH):cation symporter [Treponema sp.]|nr:glycoside-pentoside-hexuronide (GPH):cation symporter [Treponema sp.]